MSTPVPEKPRGDVLHEPMSNLTGSSVTSPVSRLEWVGDGRREGKSEAETRDPSEAADTNRLSCLFLQYLWVHFHRQRDYREISASVGLLWEREGLNASPPR